MNYLHPFLYAQETLQEEQGVDAGGSKATTQSAAKFESTSHSPPAQPMMVCQQVEVSGAARWSCLLLPRLQNPRQAHHHLHSNTSAHTQPCNTSGRVGAQRTLVFAPESTLHKLTVVGSTFRQRAHKACSAENSAHHTPGTARPACHSTPHH